MSEKETEHPHPAAAPQQQQTTEVVVDDSGTLPSYSNFCRVTATPEEVILDFGLNPQPFATGRQDVKANQRIVMNFYTAKRLLTALGMTIQRHEETFGSIELDVRRRARAAPSSPRTRSRASRPSGRRRVSGAGSRHRPVSDRSASDRRRLASMRGQSSTRVTDPLRHAFSVARASSASLEIARRGSRRGGRSHQPARLPEALASVDPVTATPGHQHALSRRGIVRTSTPASRADLHCPGPSARVDRWCRE